MFALNVPLDSGLTPTDNVPHVDNVKPENISPLLVMVTITLFVLHIVIAREANKLLLNAPELEPQILLFVQLILLVCVLFQTVTLPIAREMLIVVLSVLMDSGLTPTDNVPHVDNVKSENISPLLVMVTLTLFVL